MNELQASEFNLLSCQATFFTPDEEISSTKLLKGLCSTPAWSAQFDAEPTVLPIPPTAPRNIPRLVLESESRVWKCEFSSERVNFFWRKTTGGPTVRTEDFFATAAKFLNEYANFQRTRVGRIAGVLSRVAPHPAPARFLAQHFCQERWHTAPFDRPGGFELNAHKRFLLGQKFNVNSWVRNKSGRASLGGELEPVVAVEQDLNTLDEEADSKDYKVDDIDSFFRAGSLELDTILALYYPEIKDARS